MPPTTRPAGRYGESRPAGRRRTVVAVGALGAAFLAWVTWAALGAARTEPTAQVTAFRIMGAATTEARVSATGPDGPIVCTVRALDRTREVVGVGEVTLDAGAEGSRERWVTIRTRERAVTATVGGCSAGG